MVGVVRSDTERNPLRIELRVPVDRRSSASDLARIEVKGSDGQLVSLAELGRWETGRVDQMIYHKNLQRVAYVFAETAGRPPADVVVDVLADRTVVQGRGPVASRSGFEIAKSPNRQISPALALTLSQRERGLYSASATVGSRQLSAPCRRAHFPVKWQRHRVGAAGGIYR